VQEAKQIVEKSADLQGLKMARGLVEYRGQLSSREEERLALAHGGKVVRNLDKSANNSTIKLTLYIPSTPTGTRALGLNTYQFPIHTNLRFCFSIRFGYAQLMTRNFGQSCL
jgi:hypothetical protein